MTTTTVNYELKKVVDIFLIRYYIIHIDKLGKEKIREKQKNIS